MTKGKKDSERATESTAVETSKPEKADATPSKAAKNVRISVIGGAPTKIVAGYRFTKEPQNFKAGALNWEAEDWAAAHADPNLVIEPTDENGKPVGK